MNRFKKTIAGAVTTFLLVMAFSIIPVSEAQGRRKAPFDHSYLPPANMAKAGRSARISTPTVGVRKTARSSNQNGMFRGIRSSRRSYILPYIEQDNLYR